MCQCSNVVVQCTAHSIAQRTRLAVSNTEQCFAETNERSRRLWMRSTFSWVELSLNSNDRSLSCVECSQTTCRWLTSARLSALFVWGSEQTNSSLNRANTLWAVETTVEPTFSSTEALLVSTRVLQTLSTDNRPQTDHRVTTINHQLLAATDQCHQPGQSPVKPSATTVQPWAVPSAAPTRRPSREARRSIASWGPTTKSRRAKSNSCCWAPASPARVPSSNRWGETTEQAHLGLASWSYLANTPVDSWSQNKTILLNSSLFNFQDCFAFFTRFDLNNFYLENRWEYKFLELIWLLLINSNRLHIRFCWALFTRHLFLQVSYSSSPLDTICHLKRLLECWYNYQYIRENGHSFGCFLNLKVNLASPPLHASNQIQIFFTILLKYWFTTGQAFQMNWKRIRRITVVRCDRKVYCIF